MTERDAGRSVTNNRLQDKVCNSSEDGNHVEIDADKAGHVAADLRALVPVNLTPEQLEPYSAHRDIIFDGNSKQKSSLGIRNVAFTGPYGAGKSSLVRSWDEGDQDTSYLYISVARFSESEKKGDVTPIREIESRLINQLVHKIDPQTVPMSRFRRTANLGHAQTARVSVCVGLFVALQSGLAYLLGKDSLGPRGTVLAILGLIAIVILVARLVYYIMRHGLITRILSSLKFMGIDITVDDGKQETLFDNYLDDLLYLIDGSDMDVIVFEDLDRYNLVSPFESLREINDLANARRFARKAKPIRFFYLITDGLFENPADKTKLFDYIVPVIPYIDPNNAYTLLFERLRKIGLTANEECVRRLAMYLSDPRILNEITNETWHFKHALFERAGISSITKSDDDKLLTAVAYKVLFPGDYDCLQQGHGYLYTVMRSGDYLKNRARDKVLTKLLPPDSTQKMRKRRFEERPSVIERESLSTLVKEYGFDALTEDFRSALNCPDGGVNGVPINHLTKDELEAVCASRYYPWLRSCILIGYLDESYPRFLSGYHKEGLSVRDQWFVRGLLGNDTDLADLELDNPALVLKSMTVTDLKSRSARNYSLFEELLKRGNETKRDGFVSSLTSPEADHFICAYVTSSHFVSSAFEVLAERVLLVLLRAIDDGQCDYETKVLWQKKCIFAGNDSTQWRVVDASYGASDEARTLRDFARSFPDALDIPLDSKEAACLVFTLRAIGFIVDQVNADSANVNLLEAIYQDGLYECTFSNVKALLAWAEKEEGQKSTSDVLVTVYRLGNSPLRLHVTANMGKFISSVTRHKKRLFLPEDVVLWVLNCPSSVLSKRIAKRFLRQLQGTPVVHLNMVSEERLGLVVHGEKFEPNSGNLEWLFAHTYRVLNGTCQPLPDDVLRTIKRGGLDALSELKHPNLLLQAMAATPAIRRDLVLQLAPLYQCRIERLCKGLDCNKLSLLARNGVLALNAWNVYAVNEWYYARSSIINGLSRSDPDEYARILLEDTVRVENRTESVFNASAARTLIHKGRVSDAYSARLRKTLSALDGARTDSGHAQDIVDRHASSGVYSKEILESISALFSMGDEPNLLMPTTMLLDLLGYGIADPSRVLSNQIEKRMNEGKQFSDDELRQLLRATGLIGCASIKKGETITLAKAPSVERLAVALVETKRFAIVQEMDFGFVIQRL